MTIYITGGSNSRMKKGWAPKFSKQMREQETVRNISIGGVPSYVGFYQSLFNSDLEPGDTLIWEYALNDENHIDFQNYDASDLLRGIEYLLIGCAHAQVKFGALIMRTRRRHLSPVDCIYDADLKDLFERYNVPYFDVNDEFARRRPYHGGVKHSHYSNFAHYDPESSIIKFIADGVVEICQEARPPEADPNAVVPLRAIEHFDGGTASTFDNRAISVTTWDPGEDGISFTPAKAGKVIGLVALCTPEGGMMALSTETTTQKFSVTFSEDFFSKPMVKYISVPALVGAPLTYEAGERLRLAWADTAEGALANRKFADSLSEEILAKRESRIVAVLVEDI